MRIIIHQGLKPEEMSRKEPNKTKMMSFVSDRTNMYIIPRCGGGVGIFHTPSYPPGSSWEGFIFDKNSDKLIEEMIAGLKYIQKHKNVLFGIEEKPVRKSEILLGKPKKKAKADVQPSGD